jgi:cell division septation protein DedD
VDRREARPDERSASARYFILGFLALVALCAVFFSLGFLIGYNQRAPKPTPVAENVSGPSEIPPTVNPPAQTSAPSANAGPATTSDSASEPAPETPKPRHAASSEVQPTRSTAKHAATAKARAERAPRNEAGPAHVAPTGGAGAGYSVQVMAARTSADANSLTGVLKTRGYPAFVLAPQAIGSNDSFYRVLVGPYTSRAAAEKVRDKLEKEGFKPFIKH